MWGHGVRAGCTLFHRRSTSRRCTRRGPTSARVGPAGMQLTAGAVGPASAGRHATLNRAWNSIVVFFIGGITPVAEPPCSGTLGPGCASYVGSRATVLNGFCIAQWRLQPLDATTVRLPAPLGALGGKARDVFGLSRAGANAPPPCPLSMAERSHQDPTSFSSSFNRHCCDGGSCSWVSWTWSWVSWACSWVSWACSWVSWTWSCKLSWMACANISCSSSSSSYPAANAR